MLITNTKTNTTFSGYTVADRNGYAAVVTRREGNKESLVIRNVFSTRSKAYYNARKEACAAAMSHAAVYGM
jgi:hypothetical protein